MSSLELAVAILGVVAGYWIVSVFFLKGKPARSTSNDSVPEQEAPAEEPARVPPASWHVILDVAPDASVEEIKKAYRSLISQYHPDKVATLGSELQELAERKSREITQAYREALQARNADD